MRRMIPIAYLLDTWAWIDHLKNNNPAVSLILRGNEPVFTSVVTLTEIFILSQRGGGREQGERAVRFISEGSRILPVTPEIAIRAGTYEKKKFAGGIADRLIRATSENNNLLLVTGDQHFKGLAGVQYLGKK
jgi:predicted nucleic acid-binding protein